MDTQQQSELKVFPREQPSEKKGREKSLGSVFKLSRNSNSVTKTQNQNCSIVLDLLRQQDVQK